MRMGVKMVAEEPLSEAALKETELLEMKATEKYLARVKALKLSFRDSEVDGNE